MDDPDPQEAQQGGPHSEIQVELDWKDRKKWLLCGSIFQAETCQIVGLAGVLD